MLNKFGRPIAYRVAGLKDGVVDYTIGSYIPAKDVIHIANRNRIGQLKSTPMCSPQRLKRSRIYTRYNLLLLLR